MNTLASNILLLLSKLEKERRFFVLRSEASDFLKNNPEVKSDAEFSQQLVDKVRNWARPPISNYQVGAVAREKTTGHFLLGVNLEFTGLALNQTVHAEQFVVAHALLRRTQIDLLTVTAAPCGYCRQWLNELAGGSELEIRFGSTQVQLRDLLPKAFGPADLGIQGALLAHPSLALTLDSFQGGKLWEAARTAAQKSYCPYSKSPSGVALKLQNGDILSGPYIETAAFNPSLSPLQTALVELVTSHYSYSDVQELVLVERSNAPVSQRAATENMRRALFPTAPILFAEIREA